MLLNPSTETERSLVFGIEGNPERGRWSGMGVVGPQSWVGRAHASLKSPLRPGTFSNRRSWARVMKRPA